jgi:hypothetical protein
MNSLDWQNNLSHPLRLRNLRNFLVLETTSVAKAGAPAGRPKEIKVSLTKGFDLCRTFCFLGARRCIHFVIWAARSAAQMTKIRFARETDFHTGHLHFPMSQLSID